LIITKNGVTRKVSEQKFDLYFKSKGYKEVKSYKEIEKNAEDIVDNDVDNVDNIDEDVEHVVKVDLDGVNLEEMTNDDLRILLKNQGKPTYGAKAELVARLQE